MRALVLAAAALCACGDQAVVLDQAVALDGAGVELGPGPDGGAALAAGFSVVGCALLDVTLGAPHCSGSAPLDLTFVPLASGVTSFLWTFPGGDPNSSTAIAPNVRYARSGVFTVTLTAGGPAGTAQSIGTVSVSPGGLGAPCSDPTDCDANLQLQCICGQGACPGALAGGLCTRGCTGACSQGICVDLTGASSGGAPSDGGAPPNPDGGSTRAGEGWRAALCLPGCSQSSDCRPGLLCRELPVAGVTPSWRKACFADWPGDVGDSCADASGAASGAFCLSGRCDSLGARGLCTAPCSPGSCPQAAACATWNGAPAAPLCLRRCDATHACTDPLLSCELPGRAGAFGFTVAPGDPPGTSYCAPKHCTQASDCAPAGTCQSLGGGSFCMR